VPPHPTPAPPVPPHPTPNPPAPTPHNPFRNQQWLGPSTETKNTMLFKGRNGVVSHSSWLTVFPTAANTYKCVELQGGDTANGTPIVINTCNDGKTQQWTYDPFTSGYIKYSADQTKCIDLIGADTTNGNKLQIWVSAGA
jgi:hypothetical protein